MASIAEMAVACRVAASGLAVDVENAEALTCRLLESPGVRRALDELRVNTALVAEAHDLLKKLSPHEARVRALIAASPDNPREQKSGPAHVPIRMGRLMRGWVSIKSCMAAVVPAWRGQAA